MLRLSGEKPIGSLTDLHFVVARNSFSDEDRDRESLENKNAERILDTEPFNKERIRTECR